MKKPEKYHNIKLLGEGNFGRAYLVEAESNKANYVIKELDILSKNPEEKQKILQEAKIMKSLAHPNIVSFKEVYKTKRDKLCIVMEYAGGKSL